MTIREARKHGLRGLGLIDMGSDFRINLHRQGAVANRNGVIDPKERDTNDTKVGTKPTYQKKSERTVKAVVLSDFF